MGFCDSLPLSGTLWTLWNFSASGISSSWGSCRVSIQVLITHASSTALGIWICGESKYCKMLNGQIFFPIRVAHLVQHFIGILERNSGKFIDESLKKYAMVSPWWFLFIYSKRWIFREAFMLCLTDCWTASWSWAWSLFSYVGKICPHRKW